MNRTAFWKRMEALAIALVLSLFVASCASGDDDDDDSIISDDDDDNKETGSGCEETTTALAATDTVGEIVGMSAAGLLEGFGEGFTAAAEYGSDPSLIAQTPMEGETEITVSVVYSDGEIREIDSHMIETDNEMYAICEPRLEVDVTIIVKTADGAFDESWDGVIAVVVSEQLDENIPYLEAKFDPYEISGSFTLDDSGSEDIDSVEGAFYSIATEPFEGDIRLLVEQSTGEGDDGVSSATNITSLSW